MSDNELKKLREQIDKIDDRMLELLTERSSIVRQVGKLKSSSGQKRSIIRPGREAEMVRRIAGKAGNSFPRAAIAQVWRLIISSAILIEENAHVSTHALLEDRDCFWVAREYFGQFTPMTIRPTPVEVVADVADGKATVGVVKVLDRETQRPWWSRIIEEKTQPMVFAKLPFIRVAPTEKPPIVSIGFVEPEPTDDDESLWLVKVPHSVEFAALEALAQQYELECAVMDNCTILENPVMYHYLLKISGFINEDSKKMQLFLKKANEENPGVAGLISGDYLGAYAVPILFDIPERPIAD